MRSKGLVSSVPAGSLPFEGVLSFSGEEAAHSVVSMHAQPVMEQALKDTLVEAVVEIVTEVRGWCGVG